MGFRSRVNDIRQTLIGSVTNENGDVLGYQDGTVGFYKVTEDVTGNRTGFNNLFIDQQHTQGGLLGGIRRYWATGQPDRYYNDLPVEALRHSMVDPSDVFGLGPLDINAYALKLLAKTSPANSEVNLPQFLAELKDLPGMIKNWGSLFQKENRSSAFALAKKGRQSGSETIANAVLTYRWGLAPLISDFRKLLVFQKAVEQRFKELDNLRKGRTLKRRISLDSGAVKTESGRFVVQSWQILFDGYWIDNYTHNVWGSVQWYTPSWSGLAKATDPELMRRAWQIASGMNTRSATMALWELVPWSWLADWFSNVGDILAACGNSTDMDFRGLCIMQHQKAIRRLMHNDLRFWDYECHMTPLVVRREKKYRFANVFPIAFPSLRLPVLTYSKLSIIGSLAVLRLPPELKVALRG